MSPYARWTPAELALVRELYPALGARRTARRLPGRTPVAVYGITTKLGLGRRFPPRRHPRSAA